MDIEEIIADLVYYSPYYDLKGVEFTEEDARNVNELVEKGMEYEKAIDNVLNKIYEVLAENWEY